MRRCAELSEKNIGEEVTMMGWVQKQRNKGGIIFVDMRDRSGILQVIFEDGEINEADFAKAEKLRSEFVIAVKGKVTARSGAVNENLATGAIELRAEELRVLSESDTPPFPIEADSKTKEELSKIDELKWIRILYCYPEEITDELISAIKNLPKVCHYLDMPIQHGSDDGRIDYETFRKKLQHVIDEYNHKESRFKYSVACGYADSTEAGDNNGNVDARQIYSMADDRMYVHKRKIKEKMKQEKSHNE